MDPLVVTRGFGELIDLLLGDLHPIGGGDLLTYTGRKIGQSGKGFHERDSRARAAVCLSMTRHPMMRSPKGLPGFLLISQ
jgi:hypothetical protein